ncbi:hypothetical protein JOD57_004124 [Geodermatophilus bullaregiensis]|uniref:hypothetical protein n=1 Tax=Geodermatophilus bullaregiensis TaxID=1564160 RepID=UPI001957FFD6|nr:hypothetical protein [Geodermatophilus bullaregiensis]MBM7808287.1 hypothetical protein [Geodermatophilus bullaregiensis]
MTSVLPPIEVPQLSGGRERARALVEGLGQRMAGAVIVVDFRRMVAGTPSFADELVTRVLVDGGAAALRAVHVSREFWDYLLEAARDHGVAERLQTA